VPDIRRRLVGVAAAVLLIVAAVVIIVIGRGPGSTPVVQPTGSRAPFATVGPTPTASTPSPPPTGVRSGGEPLRVVVPSVGVDAPIKPIAFQNHEINPPTVDDVYWINAYGWPGVDADNTVYLLGHSWDQGDAVFNALFDRKSQTSRVERGAEIDVVTDQGTVRYAVDRTARYPRDSLADTGEVWAKTPGRLLLITCFQQNNGLDAKDNFVVYATVIG
jgi:hypothetical protein